MRDLFNDQPYGSVNEDVSYENKEYMDKSPELVVAETLQTHLFASDEFRKHLIQETLYSLAQNGSLIGLIHLLVLVLFQLVISRSLAGKSIHLSRISVISVFSCVWIFLILTHLLFSMLQVNAIQNLDELFSTLSKGKTYLQCEIKPQSNYAEIASHCDRTAVFHTFGAYLLRGHTLFTLLFLYASILIFTITVTYHCRISKQQDFLQNGLRYHFARIAAFVDPVLNPLIVVARTPALRRQLRAQWTLIRSQASSRTAKYWRSGSLNGSKRRTGSQHERRHDAEMNLMKPDRPATRTCSLRRSQDSQTHNSVV
ncbi:hypothetical protein DICVIV_10487 [Dictyocaulus viviparus]|uniref:G-protein coupled receptors family 1 profile domain-containing protein n=1 Tax=Dictyocaulus viviparus TaxID=29172 RepID=A0A0D8XIE4_DICVI|nr:hypothetical protein DICVIV_10487 [Dictyocaulus viviparus]